MTLPTPATRRSRRANQRGITLIELLVVITIGGILAMVAVPGLQSVMRTMRENSAMSRIISDLNLARGEAIKRNVTVIMCARNADGTGCVATPTTSWSAGWVICYEGAVNQCLDTSGAPENLNPLVVRPPLDGSLNLVASADTPIRYSANSSRAAGSVWLQLQGTWSGATARCMSIAGTGNISKKTASCP